MNWKSIRFQSPGGDSPHCHPIARPLAAAEITPPGKLFQSPGGASPHCHPRTLRCPHRSVGGFSPPEGILLIATYEVDFDPDAGWGCDWFQSPGGDSPHCHAACYQRLSCGLRGVSVPRRGFSSLPLI